MISLPEGEKAAKLGGFFMSKGELLQTIAYIDGYNLYYGCLRSTPYKWLDVVALCRQIILAQNPAAKLAQVKFFTAEIKTKFSRHGRRGQVAQHSYHRALKTLYPSDALSIIKGYHISEPTLLPRDQIPFVLDDKVQVLRTEEKLTDVNIASHMIEDAVVEAKCEQIVLVTSDTDLAPALEVIKRHKPHTHMGLVLPRREVPALLSDDDIRPARHPNRRLSELADWTRNHIRNEELAAAQMPDMVPTRKKPAFKPDYW